MTKIFKPVESKDVHIVKFTKAKLEDILDNLDKSGADEIGVEITPQE